MRRTRAHVADVTRTTSGRPRSAVAHQAILTATIAVIREVGYDALTMESVAQMAGVGKATLYRRWNGKEMLVAAALEQLAVSIANPDTGSLHGDVLAVMRSTAAMYRDPATGALLSGLVAAISRSEPIAAAFRGGFVVARRAALHHVLMRWKDRGVLRTDLDLEILMDLISGPPFYRFLMRGEIVSDAVVEASLDVLLRGMATTAFGNPTEGGNT